MTIVTLQASNFLKIIITMGYGIIMGVEYYRQGG